MPLKRVPEGCGLFTVPVNLNSSTIHPAAPLILDDARSQPPSFSLFWLILIKMVELTKRNHVSAQRRPSPTTGHQNSDFISIHVTSASGRAACGDKTLLRYTAFSSHYMDTSKNILNAKQIRWGVRLQNILFMVGNGKVAADEEFVVWQVPCPHGKSLRWEAP